MTTKSNFIEATAWSAVIVIMLYLGLEYDISIFGNFNVEMCYSIIVLAAISVWGSIFYGGYIRDRNLKL